MSAFFSKTFFPTLKDRGVTRIFHLGDLFDRRKYVNFLTAERCYSDYVYPAKEAGATIEQIVGNHDSYYRNTNEVNSPRVLYGDVCGHMRIHVGPAEVEFGSGKALLLPWICDANREESLRATASSSATIVLGHLELEGFEMHRGQKAEKGMSSSLFDRFADVMSGHFHTQSKLGNIRYVGAAGQYTWADYDDPRGFWIVDTETREAEFVANPNEAFCKIHYDEDESTEESLAEQASRAAGKFVKLIVRSRTDSNKLSRAVDAIEKSGVELQVVDDHRRADDFDDELQTEELDTLEAIERSVEELGDPTVYAPAVVERARAVARELYQEASSQS